MKEKNVHYVISLSLISMLMITACEDLQTQPTTAEMQEVSDGEQQALTALTKFFDYLYEGKYDEAVKLYGGSYQTLVEYNSEIAPGDHTALMRAACTINGFQCLRIRNALLQEEISSSEYVFVVEFINDDGSLFIRGPCCGTDETEKPSASQFTFHIVRGETGEFLVQDLPVYVP